MKKILWFGAFVLLLSGCVVEDGDDDGENEASGLWRGTANGRTVTALVLNDGTSYFFYSLAADASITAGVISGDADAEDGTFDLTNGIHLTTAGPGTVNTGTVAGTYNASAMNVIMTSADPLGSVAFSGLSQSEFDNTPSLAAVSGTYAGTITVLGLSESVNVTISTSSVTIDSANCDATGTITPASTGNFYSVSLMTTACTGTNANSSFSGHAVLFDGTRLFLFAPNAGSTSGIMIDAD